MTPRAPSSPQGFRDVDAFDLDEHGLVELPVEVWHGWVFGRALHPLGSPGVPSFDEHLGDVAGLLAPYDMGALVLVDRTATGWRRTGR
jgi:phenylpropionate dioxygenase-like ring-hydroxylating dioxygenase large terminal subunit